jgi:hypothetical protein
LNKLAVLALTVLVTLSTLLWYLANQSLNEYLKSQIELQGSYYSGLQTNVDISDFSSSTEIGVFKNLSLLNLKNLLTRQTMYIDEIHIALLRQPAQPLLTTVKTVTINTLTLNTEITSDKENNIEKLMEITRSRLAHDYPELYPNISAKIYAKNNPELNAEEYALNNPQSGPIVEHTKAKKQRGKPQGKINISTILIKTLKINTIHNGLTEEKLLHDVKISSIGGEQGVVVNQLGGEILLSLLGLAFQS